VDPDIAGKRVGEDSIQLFTCHWPGDDESRLSIVTTIVDTSIFSILKAEIAGLQDPSRNIRELWGSREGLMEMVVRVPVMFPQSSITRLLPEESRW